MVARIKFTESGQQVISQKLIGKDVYIYISPDESGLSSPNGPLRYFDNYVRGLYSHYPPGDIFGQPGEERRNLEIADYFIDEPGLGTHGRNLLRRILQENALAGLWQPDVIDIQALEHPEIASAEDYLEAIKQINRAKKPKNGFERTLYGIHIAYLRGFVLPSQCRFPKRGKEYVLVIPSQKFVEHVINPKSRKTS